MNPNPAVAKIIKWLQEEQKFCKEKYDGVVEDYINLPLPIEETRDAFWYSGRIDTCERLLRFINETTAPQKSTSGFVYYDSPGHCSLCGRMTCTGGCFS